jgi:WhiB family redox-sensing transcriptional regulator
VGVVAVTADGARREAWAWMADAACRGMDPALFFPERGEDTRPALNACAVCPVTAECLAYATAHAWSGIWGGTTQRERRTNKRHRRPT